MKKNELRNRIVKTVQKEHPDIEVGTMLAISNIVNDYLVLDKKYKNIPKVCTCGRRHREDEIEDNKCSKCRGFIEVEITVKPTKNLRRK